ncbi:MAG: peptidoglycan editing factor PgeF [Myxococcales bacterium]|nr:peptidoglycan editing factor PgeF [Myxococcales bacterium]
MDRVSSLAIDGVVHGFTDRRGGVSSGPRASLNLALRGSETLPSLAENLRRAATTLAPAWGAGRVALLSQVHGNDVVRVTAPPEEVGVPVAEADAAFTTVPGICLAVRTADCVPVLFAWPAAEGVPPGVGVAHAGWRGVAADIVTAWLRRVRKDLGVPATSVRAAIGPAICGAAYEVGSEVVDALLEAGLERDDFLMQGKGSKPHVDLRRAVRAQLAAAGVQQVGQVDRCTATDAQLFSHRADGPQTGRQAGIVARVT